MTSIAALVVNGAIWREGRFAPVAETDSDLEMSTDLAEDCHCFDYCQGASIRGIFVGRGGIFRPGRN